MAFPSSFFWSTLQPEDNLISVWVFVVLWCISKGRLKTILGPWNISLLPSEDLVVGTSEWMHLLWEGSEIKEVWWNCFEWILHLI